MFPKLTVRYQCNCARCRPGRRIYLRVDDRQSHLKQSVVEPLVPFLNPHLISVRIAARFLCTSTLDRSWSSPRPVVVAIGLNDERISFPPAHGIIEISRDGRIRRQFASVSPDVPPRVPPLDELQNAVR